MKFLPDSQSAQADKISKKNAPRHALALNELLGAFTIEPNIV